MSLRKRAAITWGIAAVLVGAIAAGCGQGGQGEGGGERLSGKIQADGSSTVFPIAEAMAEEFRAVQPGVQVTVGTSGTGGGFEKFCNDEIEIANASRPIKEEEAAKCKEKDIEYVELQVAYDGLSVMVNPNNDFVKCLTTDQLKAIWGPGSKVKTWKDVDSKWPAEVIKLYGPGTDSGTFDYFTKEINGEEGASRSDYTASEDDNVLVQGVAGDDGSLGYFGYAYYSENRDKLKLVEVDGGKGCVAPSKETILDGTYAPLSRPIFIYVKKSALEREEVAEFAKFYIEQAKELVPTVGYIAAQDEVYEAEQEELKGAL